MSPPLLAAEDLAQHYRLPRSAPWRAAEEVRAVDGVSFELEAGGSLGIVGESGSGKSTLARLVMGFETPGAGRVLFEARDLAAIPSRELRALRRHFQMIFQDPFGSLDPRHTVGRIVAEPLAALDDPGDRRARIAEALRHVSLRPEDAAKYPHEFSGGQRQRIAIARALITRPGLVVADEPVSALDVSVQAQVLNLLKELREAHGIALLLISHDLAVVDFITDAVAVMYRGRFVETGPTAEVLAEPRHPYTVALKEAVPTLTPGRRRLRARLAGPSEAAPPPAGCAFAPRCPRAAPRCAAEAPALREVAPGRHAACHFA
jgi:peptide/nickel transport system ATP-binding protein